MSEYCADIPKYRKRSSKSPPKKSKHKHEYETLKIEAWRIDGWFTHRKVCRICGKEQNRTVIDGKEY